MPRIVDAKMIGAWAHTLCTETDTNVVDMVFSLGFSGKLDRQPNRYDLRPVPPGLERVSFGLAGEAFDSLEVEVEAPVLTADLEPHLGASRILGAGRIGYRRTVPEAPNECAIAVDVDGGRVKRLTLRREPAVQPSRMLTASVAFALGYAPAKLVALHATSELLAQLASESGVKSHDRLAHAVRFGTKALPIEITLANPKLDTAIVAGRAAGIELRPKLSDRAGWPRFDAGIHEALGVVGDVSTGFAYRLGVRARDLYTAWARAEKIAYLRAAAADYPTLVAAAAEVVGEVAAAWSALASELRGTPSLDERRGKLEKWNAVAAQPDAVTSTCNTAGAYGQIADWLKTLDMLLGGIPKDIPPAGVAAPRPSAPAKATGHVVQLTELLSRAKELAASGAMTSLELAGAGGRVAELAALPELAQVQQLQMRDQGITDADIQALASSPHAAGLRYLGLEQNEIGQAGVEAMASSKYLRALEIVALDLNRVHDPADQFELYDETHRERVATDAGKALEAKYGRIAWLHPPE